MNKRKAIGFAFRSASAIVLTQINLLLAVQLIRYLESQKNDVEKAGGMTLPAYNAESVNLKHFNPIRVSYDPKDIHTEAIQITTENIGKLSLEFEEELFHDPQGRPYFVFSAQRSDETTSELYVRLTDWIVPLWDQLYVFRDGIFQNTFTFDFEQGGQHAAPVALARPYVDEHPVLSLNAQMNVSSTSLGVMDFKANDRVYIDETGDFGTVTVVGVEKGNGVHGVEVKLDTGEYLTFDPTRLRFQK